MDGTAPPVELDGHRPQTMTRIDRLSSAAKVALVLLCFCPSLRSAAQGPQESPESRDVLRWNIYLRPTGIFWNEQMKRAEHIGMLLKDLDHDVLLFQEAFGRKSRKVLRKALGGSLPYEVLPVGNGRMLYSGLRVLSRIPIHAVQGISFRSCMA